MEAPRGHGVEEIERKTASLNVAHPPKIPENFSEPLAAPAPAAPLASPAPDLAAPLVAQAAGPLKGVIDAVAMLMISGLAPGPPADPDPDQPEAGSALARRPQPRRAAQQLPVASSCGFVRVLSRTSRAVSG